jgi:hypothetical protein
MLPAATTGVIHWNRRRTLSRWLRPHPLLVLASISAGAALASGRAQACGASPSPSYTIAGVIPGSGSSEVARDTGIVISGTPSSPSGGPTEFAEVALIDDETDEAQQLISISWHSLAGPEDTMALYPARPLAPQHRYRVEAKPMNLEDGSEGASFVSRFTTSDALLEPLVLTGELELSLRGGELDVTDCDPCGDGCVVTGKRRALLAGVTLPAPSGGQGIYRGVLHFSDNVPARVSARNPADYESVAAEPHEIQVSQYVKIEPDEALTLEQEVFEEDFSYAGCFRFVVWDPAGHVAEASACLPSLSPDDVRTFAEHDGEIHPSSYRDTGSDQVPSAADGGDDAASRGCAIGGSQAAAFPAWFTLLLAFVLVQRMGPRRRV